MMIGSIICANFKFLFKKKNEITDPFLFNINVKINVNYYQIIYLLFYIFFILIINSNFVYTVSLQNQKL
jgi:hypothetical protein